MSDFPSIGNLANPPAADDNTNPNDPQIKFAAKMKQIQKGEKEKITADQAAGSDMPYIDLTGFPVSSEALKVIPLELAQEKKVICFYSTPAQLRIGMLEPTEEIKELAYQLSERHHAEVIFYLISENSLDRVLKLYANLPVIKPISKDIDISEEDLNRFQNTIENLQSLQEQFNNISISDILTLIVA
ncbi:MAG TPA: hypothetical protein VJB62_02410, partial [Patescibacteria group bacterium]|nr:hypothetical protein [Patescibacteria group bacterium]